MSINYILDILFIVIILGMFFWGKRSGFVGIMSKFILGIIAFIVAKVGSTFLAIQIYTTAIQPMLKQKILDSVGNTVPANIDSFIQNDFLKSIPDFFSKAISSYGEIPSISNVNSVDELVNNILTTVAQPPITFILSSILFVVLLFVCLLICKIFNKGLTKIISKIPLIGGTNKLLGSIVGIIFAFTLCYVIAKCLALYIGLAGDGNALNLTTIMINKTYLFKHFYFL